MHTNKSRSPFSVRYCPEIDGLRAIAILTVVGFHIGLPGFEGGFIGVDIFFVISGFLITSLLLNELNKSGSIDVLAFFGRRARRLLPAFFLVISVTLLLGLIYLNPNYQQQHLATSATAALLYVSNFFFGWSEEGYFGPNTDLYPLLHTWSLAVEEQFYLLWPLILVAVAAIAKRWGLRYVSVVSVILALIVAVSLGYSWGVKEAGSQAQQFAFFSIGARAWELGMGASLALLFQYLPQRNIQSAPLLIAPFLIVLGIICMGASVTMFHEGMLYPGLAALLPVLGASATIAGVWLAPNSRVGKLLSFRPLVVIGLVSYSWYLWHWPLLSIARAQELGHEDLWRDSAIAACALGLAFLTYALIEKPVRNRRVAFSWSNLRFLGMSAVGSLILLVGAQALAAHAGRLAQFEIYKEIRQAVEDKGWSRERCENDEDAFERLVPVSECLKIDYKPSKVVVLWGDSHSDHMVGALEEGGKDEKWALLPRWMAGCPPLIGTVPTAQEGSTLPNKECSKFNAAVLDEIRSLKAEGRLFGVVLGARWSMYLGEPSLAGENGRTLWRDGRALNGDQAVESMTQGLRLLLDKLPKVNVLVIAPTPEQRFEVPDCLARHDDEFCSVDRDIAEARRAVALLAVEKALTDSSEVQMWDPLPDLCDGVRCPAKRSGIIMYADDEHLTYSASKRLGRSLRKNEAWASFIGK